ncbi:hypothetical protein P4E94_13440 [Pontiellaceae bacterium B12219]|nr:hypothetical protein [Pontiellaceae bacterium B12219]
MNNSKTSYNPLRILLTSALLVFVGLSTQQAHAEVDIRLDLTHSYSNYYATLYVTTDSTPITYHRVQSANGKYWKNVGADSSRNAPAYTNDLNAVIYGLTNDLWEITLNVGDASEAKYTYSLAINDVTTNLFGDITITAPEAKSTITNNPPAFEWITTSSLPETRVRAYNPPRSVELADQLPESTTNWTPNGTLSPGTNTFFVRNLSNDFVGVTYSTPTNIVNGSALSNWSGTADVWTYAIRKFEIVEPEPEIPYGAAFALNIQRDASNRYRLYPDLINPVPAAATLHEITSPNGLCTATESTSTSPEFPTLAEALSECTNGTWTLEFDQGSASNRIYYFSVELDGIDTNTLAQTLILTPANGTTNHFGNPRMAWIGPTNFTDLSVSVLGSDVQFPAVATSLPATQTNWPDAPALAQGTNTFSITYIYDYYPGITASWPTNDLAEGLDIWSVNGQLTTRAASSFEVKAGSPPYDVLTMGMNEDEFSLFFTPRLFPDFSYTLLTSTNLVEGHWHPISTFKATGAPLLFSPAESNAAAYYRVLLDPGL